MGTVCRGASMCTGRGKIGVNKGLRQLNLCMHAAEGHKWGDRRRGLRVELRGLKGGIGPGFVWHRLYDGVGSVRHEMGG